MQDNVKQRARTLLKIRRESRIQFDDSRTGW